VTIGGAVGFIDAAVIRALDFWPVGLASNLRELIDLLGTPLLLLSTLIALLSFLGGAIISLYRRRFRRMASSLAAIAVVPLCFLTVVRATIFDPWLWYVVLNKSDFDALAAGRENMQPLMVMRDVSTGIAGLNSNHFIEIIYSESNIDGHRTAHSVTTHLYGNFYRRDESE